MIKQPTQTRTAAQTATAKANTGGAMRRRLVMMILMLGMLGAATAARAAVYTVMTTADSGAGSLRQAIIDANATTEPDTINISATGTITLTSGQLTIANNGALTINGLGANQLTVSGNDASRVFYVNSGANVTISGLTISRGRAFSVQFGDDGFGGGIFNNGGTVNLTNSTVSGNSASSGGGIRSFATLNSRNSIIANSTGGGTLNFQNSLVEDGLCGVTSGVNNLMGDPNLGTLADNGGPTLTHALQSGSIAIDAGNSTLTNRPARFSASI